MARELLSFEEVLQDTLSGLGALLPKNKAGWQILSDKREGLAGAHHPVTIVPAGSEDPGYRIPVFDGEDVYGYYRATKDEKAAIQYFADLYQRALQQKSADDLQDLALLLCRDPLLFRRNTVAWLVRADDPAAKDRPKILFGDLALIVFVSLERFGVEGAVPIKESTKVRMPFCKEAKDLYPQAMDNRSDIDPMVIRDLSEEYAPLLGGGKIYQVTTMTGAHGASAILYASTRAFLEKHLGERYLVLPVGTDTCLALTAPGPVSVPALAEKICREEEIRGKIPPEKRLTHTAYCWEGDTLQPIH